MNVSYKELNKQTTCHDPVVALVDRHQWYVAAIPDRTQQEVDLRPRWSRAFGYWVEHGGAWWKIIDSIIIPELLQQTQDPTIEILGPAQVKLVAGPIQVTLTVGEQGFVLQANKLVQASVLFDIQRGQERLFNRDAYRVVPMSNGYRLWYVDPTSGKECEIHCLYDGQPKFKQRWQEVENKGDALRGARWQRSSAFELCAGPIRELRVFMPDRLTRRRSQAVKPLQYHQADSLSSFFNKRLTALRHANTFYSLPWKLTGPARETFVSLWALQERPAWSANLLSETMEAAVANDELESMLWFLLLADDETSHIHHDRLSAYLTAWLRQHIPTERFFHPEHQSWMQTLKRPRPLEIEALLVAALEKFRPRDSWLARLGRTIRRTFKTHLVTERYPADELNRPNIFLAYLLVPSLCMPSTWECLFDRVIERTQTSWGGLATIPITSPEANLTHSGESADSWHRGDSHLWLNHLAGRAMKSLNPDKYKIEIDSLRRASLRNTFQHGALGWPSELSSALELRSEGNLVHAPALATLIDLMDQ